MPGIRVVKRTGDVVNFDQERIQNAILKAVKVAEKTEIDPGRIETLTDAVVEEVERRFIDFYPNVENIQDIVEKHLVLDGLYATAKAYILYRAERQTMRQQAQKRAIQDARLGKLTVIKRDGHTALFSVKKLEQNILRAADELGDQVDVDMITREVINNVYDEVPAEHIERALVLASAAFIERDPCYNYVAARLLLQKLYKEVIGRSTHGENLDRAYREAFHQGIRTGAEEGRFDSRMTDFDLDLLANSLKLERDLEFQYLGVQTLYDRYFLRADNVPVELPQGFWMRVAMGLAIEEDNPNERALEFYNLMSQLLYVPSTPTLFHAGTAHPQLSSCYLTTVNDDLKHIFKCLADNAQLSKWSGGIGNDWTNIRATGSRIHSTNVESQGVVPFLKIANDVTMAINRSGKRRGATCAYMETWHYDIEDFLDLRKNTGDERRRTHDMNTANWIPDLFMKRVIRDEAWTLFSPDETPDLHSLYGSAFERAYIAYESKAEAGEILMYKSVQAKDLWRKMLTMLFETGHPWMTFKDPCNIRSPQDHVGVIHSSNLCTEITLNTSADETAVCNLGSINLARHVGDEDIDVDRLATTTATAMRMLDNVIDINYYPTDEAKNSNFKHRPVGLGVMGFQDALYKLNIPFESQDALDLTDRIQEIVSYHAILSSSQIAKERGSYPTFSGSKWDRGIFPFDTLDLLEKERGVPVEVNRTQRLDWGPVKRHVAEHGMRNSNTMAIAPTATISNISGCFPCIEAIYKNIYVKANISGEFTIVNSYLIEDLEKLGMWNDEMLDQLKYYDGSVQQIPGIPDTLRAKYKEAFEISSMWALRLTAARAKWIDQSQSHNVFMKGVSGRLLSEAYIAAWKMGIKTTYYLRSLAASQVEKSTLDAKKYGFTQKREYETPTASTVGAVVAEVLSEVEASDEPPIITSRQPDPKLCRIDDPDCEACQ
ncbi:MAG: ribonucleoside-diphosphate reductase subunit alpha [Thermoanaerobaculia bacterium]|nr:ribonucleoside-diphosphate reductase subunit alpha [Thermoanaerobaculia bacterium]